MIFKTKNQRDGLEGPRDKVPWTKDPTCLSQLTVSGEEEWGGTGQDRWDKMRERRKKSEERNYREKTEEVSTAHPTTYAPSSS